MTTLLETGVNRNFLLEGYFTVEESKAHFDYEESSMPVIAFEFSVKNMTDG